MTEQANNVEHAPEESGSCAGVVRYPVENDSHCYVAWTMTVDKRNDIAFTETLALELDTCIDPFDQAVRVIGALFERDPTSFKFIRTITLGYPQDQPLNVAALFDYYRKLPQLESKLKSIFQEVATPVISLKFKPSFRLDHSPNEWRKKKEEEYDQNLRRREQREPDEFIQMVDRLQLIPEAKAPEKEVTVKRLSLFEGENILHETMMSREYRRLSDTVAFRTFKVFGPSDESRFHLYQACLINDDLGVRLKIWLPVLSYRDSRTSNFLKHVKTSLELLNAAEDVDFSKPSKIHFEGATNEDCAWLASMFKMSYGLTIQRSVPTANFFVEKHRVTKSEFDLPEIVIAR